jgi:hypothetical protein
MVEISYNITHPVEEVRGVSTATAVEREEGYFKVEQLYKRIEPTLGRYYN